MTVHAITSDPKGELRWRCERALVAAARAAGAGTRQQLRAAARRFVRRHRGDAGYLGFVLRSVLANAAIAAVLLGLTPLPAHAAATHFVERFGAANPMSGEFFPSNSLPPPTFGDLDADGDADLLVGYIDTYGAASVNRYYENTGSAVSASFVERMGSANPLSGQGLLGGAFADLDADGDLDLVAFAATPPPVAISLRYFENTGSPTLPAFLERTGAASPLDGIGAGFPTLGDLDADGDLDLLISGSASGSYFENTGSASSPDFVLRTGSANPVGDLLGVFGAVPVDLDRDGDLDLALGMGFGLDYRENVGNATSPAYVNRPGAADPFYNFGTPPFLFVSGAPAFADLDRDGDLDLMVGSQGYLVYGENLFGGFAAPLESPSVFFGQDVGGYSTPAFGDLDADGDLDVISGKLEFPGPFDYLRNTGSATGPAFLNVTGSENPTFPHDVGGHASAPTLGDLDDDGDLDLIAGDYTGHFISLRNDGTPSVPDFTFESDPDNQITNYDVGDHSTPALADLDGDGDLDLVVGETSGVFNYFENTGTAANAVFEPRTGSQNPLGAFDVGDHSKPAFVDMDRDGDLDVVAGKFDGLTDYFENTGSATAPAFVQRTGAANPMSGDFVAYLSAPAFADLDGDGDPDATVGNSFGSFIYVENAILRRSPRFAPLAPGPLVGQDVGSLSSTAAGDLDADGDLDFIASSSSGAIRYFVQVGTPGDPCQELVGAANPFDGLSAGANPRLALADVDGDADLDLVSGENGTPLRFFENVGYPTDPIYEQRTGDANPFGAVIKARSAPAFGDIDADGDLDLAVG